MYDTLEDIEPSDGESRAQTGKRRLWVSAAIIAGLATLVGVGLLSVQAPRKPVIDVEALKAEKAAYTAALTETDPALRRARLTDFLDTYKTSNRRSAAAAQLQVLSAAEADDWAVLTHIVFDIDAPSPDKIFALDRYEERWTGGVLGGRGEQILQMRNSLSEDIEDLPNRDLPVLPDDVPDADNMVGGNGSRLDFETFPDDDTDTQPPYPQTEDVITPPKVRRSVRPRYPRRALEREVEAVVVLRLFLDRRGRVVETELISAQSERYENDFIRAAERAARRTRYHPKTVNDVPVATEEGIVKRFRFRL